jgi:hypothetical protein
MTTLQKIFGVLTVLFLFYVIIYLVKKGKLREEYSWMWLFTGFILLVVVLWYDILLFLTDLIGAVLPTTTLFIFGIVFLILLSLHFAIKISLLTHEVKNLAQKVSFLEAESEQAPLIKKLPCQRK